ncbi:MAG: DUF59 domain-containing protein [Candidatus Omnitrophica bacterium]|nr:DUF59 domain-containing protein [Candidatus Omnitrophota bacterium]
MPTREEVIEAAKQCFDPEIPVNIWDLGLIYEITADDTKVSVRMSLTSQSCPAAQEIPNQFKKKIQEMLGVEDVTVSIVFDPLWTPERISEEGRKKLGIEDA